MRGRGRLDPSADAQLREDVAYVDAGCLATDEQQVGYLLIRPAICHESKNLELPRGQSGRARAGRHIGDLQPRPADEFLDPGQQGLGPQSRGGLMGGACGLRGLVSLARGKQCLGQSPARPSLLVDVAVAECIGRCLPAIGI